MAGHNQGTWVPRATLAALDGDTTAAVIYQQAAWVQDHFEGAFSVSAEWWGRMLSMSQKTVRSGLRRLKEEGWISIQRKGMDPTWWIMLTGAARLAIDAAESELEDALLWEVHGQRKSCNGGSGPKGNQAVPPRVTGQSPQGEAEPYTGNKKTVHAQPAQTQEQPRPQRHGAPPATVLAEDLARTYPHPANGGGATVRVPSAAQVEIMLLELVRMQPLRLDADTCQQIAEGAVREQRAAKRAPEAYRRTLKSWLAQLGWQEQHQSPAAQQAPGHSAPPPTDTRSAWEKLQQRGGGQ